MKAKQSQRVRPSMRQASAASAPRSAARTPRATHPPRSGEGRAPQARPLDVAAGPAEIAASVRQFGANLGFGGEKRAGARQGAGPGSGAGVGLGVEGLLIERQATHGGFEMVARITTWIRDAFRHGETYLELTTAQRIALDEMAMKQARIVCGDGRHADHWNDVAGYALLGRDTDGRPI